MKQVNGMKNLIVCSIKIMKVLERLRRKIKEKN